MKHVNVNVDKMPLVVMINNVAIKINADVNENN